MSDTRNLWKWLGPDGKPYHGGRGRWPLPTRNGDDTWNPGRPLRVTGELVLCANGLHLCRDEDLLAWCAPTLWVAQYRGEIIEVSNKVLVREARLLKQVEQWNDRTARLFAADCAERAILLTGIEDKRCWSAVEVARRYAIGQASEAELAAGWSDAGAAARAIAGAAAAAAAAAASAAAAVAAGWFAARATATARAAAGVAAAAAAAAAGWCEAGATAGDAAGTAERERQTDRLLVYLRGDTPDPVTV